MIFQRIPAVLAILSMAGGVFIAIVFGISEDIFHEKIQKGLEKNIKIQSIEDPEQKAQILAKEKSKNWRYYQRFHFHATGIGAMMMGLILFLFGLQAPARQKNIAMYLVSMGGFLYPFLWLFAGIYGPEMGRSEAKDAFEFFAYMGGLFLIGCFWTLWLGLRFDYVPITSQKK